MVSLAEDEDEEDRDELMNGCGGWLRRLYT